MSSIKASLAVIWCCCLVFLHRQWLMIEHLCLDLEKSTPKAARPTPVAAQRMTSSLNHPMRRLTLASSPS